MVQQEKRHDVHVEYNVQEKDIDGKLTNGLTITTPLGMVLITEGFSQTDFDKLTSELRSEFGYTETEMIPLTISNSEYDFILITCDAIEDEKRPLGYTWSDREGGKDGHEVDVINTGFNFVLELNELCHERKLDVGMIYNSNCYGNDSFLKNLNENMTITFEETTYGITAIQILHRGIYLSFSAIDELCIPYDAELDEH